MLAVAVIAAGCQDSRTVNPVAASVFVPNISGLWTGPMTLLSATGGECVGGVIPTFLPSNDQGTVTIGEDGTTLTATLTMESTGLACRFTGNNAAGTFTMNATSCDRTGLIVACADGRARKLELAGSSLTAVWDGQNIVGRTTSTYNVFTTDQNATGVGSLVASHSIAVTRR
jgi:hypothetical protein